MKVTHVVVINRPRAERVRHSIRRNLSWECEHSSLLRSKAKSTNPVKLRCHLENPAAQFLSYLKARGRFNHRHMDLALLIW